MQPGLDGVSDPAAASAVAASASDAAPTGVRVGCDVVDVVRFAGTLARRRSFVQTLFTDAERADAVRDGIDEDAPAAVRRLAARFAAKEAVVKLLDRPRLKWTDVEVTTGASGAPSLRLLDTATDVAVSLSHDGDRAFAVVMATDAVLADLPDFPTR